MSTTQTETRNESRKDDLHQEVQDLKKNLEVQAATTAGAQATQAAAHAGTWATMAAGASGLIVGMFLGIVLVGAGRK
jgi:hypothetical protein